MTGGTMGIGSDDRAGGATERGVLDAELLASTLLHELRQPLTGLDAAALLLERAMGPELEQRDEWRLLRQQLARLAEVMGGYAELFHAGEGQAAPFEVGPVVARAVGLLVHRIRPLGTRFSLAAADGAARGFGSPAALVHAATNLLANALDAVEGAGPEARVAIRVLPAAGGVQVRVSVEGVGVPEALRERLFQPLVSGKAPDQGGGLGLHLSRRLMARFGGEVLLVGPDDPDRLPWAVTEFCIQVPAPPAGRGA
jgi:signal transduction histidine kinase